MLAIVIGIWGLVMFFRRMAPSGGYNSALLVTEALFVIQGRNDPRVVEQESRDLVDELRGLGKDVEYLVFEDEGHDVLKLRNRVRCYESIVGFFSEHLAPG